MKSLMPVLISCFSLMSMAAHYIDNPNFDLGNKGWKIHCGFSYIVEYEEPILQDGSVIDQALFVEANICKYRREPLPDTQPNNRALWNVIQYDMDFGPKDNVPLFFNVEIGFGGLFLTKENCDDWKDLEENSMEVHVQLIEQPKKHWSEQRLSLIGRSSWHICDCEPGFDPNRYNGDVASSKKVRLTDREAWYNIRSDYPVYKKEKNNLVALRIWFRPDDEKFKNSTHKRRDEGGYEYRNGLHVSYAQVGTSDTHLGGRGARDRQLKAGECLPSRMNLDDMLYKFWEDKCKN